MGLVGKTGTSKGHGRLFVALYPMSLTLSSDLLVNVRRTMPGISSGM